MITPEILGGLGAPEILILLIVVLLILFLIFVSPVMWLQERSRRKYWQAKAEDYEKRLIDRK